MRLAKAYLKERKKKKQRERREEVGPVHPVHTEREREKSEGMASTTIVYGARRLTDWLDLALVRDRGQRAEARGRVELWVSTFLF